MGFVISRPAVRVARGGSTCFLFEQRNNQCICSTLHSASERCGGSCAVRMYRTLQHYRYLALHMGLRSRCINCISPFIFRTLPKAAISQKGSIEYSLQHVFSCLTCRVSLSMWLCGAAQGQTFCSPSHTLSTATALNKHVRRSWIINFWCAWLFSATSFLFCPPTVVGSADIYIDRSYTVFKQCAGIAVPCTAYEVQVSFTASPGHAGSAESTRATATVVNNMGDAILPPVSHCTFVELYAAEMRFSCSVENAEEI